MILCDAGVLLCLVDRTQPQHNAYRNAATDLASDYSRLLALMNQYRDRPMDLADATLVLAAEKTGYRQILTLDSDFLFYQIGDRDTFDVIQVERLN
ncbi:hypothetical protein [Phormidesmis priestleyi]